MTLWVALAVAGPLVPVAGALTDSTGAPLNGAHTLEFALYDSATAPAALWSDSDAVLLQDGAFQAVLGGGTPEITPATLRSAELWVAVRLAGGVWSSRVAVGVTPKAWFAEESAVADRALDADRLGGALPSAYARQTDVSAALAGFLPLTGGALTGALSGTAATFSGALAAGATTLSGALSGTAATFTGALSAGATTLSGALSGTSASFTGAVAGASGSFPGGVTAGASSFTGALSGTSANFSGALTAPSAAFTNTVQVGTTAEPCDAAARGRIRWTGSEFQGCTTTGWVNFTTNTLGSSAANAGTSCAAILAAHPQSPSATYFLNPGGLGVIQLYCDMTTAGGGWTLIAETDGASTGHLAAADNNISVLTTVSFGGGSGTLGDARRQALGRFYRFDVGAGRRYAYLRNPTQGAQTYWNTDQSVLSWHPSYDTFSSDPAAYNQNNTPDCGVTDCNGPAWAGRNWWRTSNNGTRLYGNDYAPDAYGKSGQWWAR